MIIILTRFLQGANIVTLVVSITSLWCDPTRASEIATAVSQVGLCGQLAGDGESHHIMDVVMETPNRKEDLTPEDWERIHTLFSYYPHMNWQSRSLRSKDDRNELSQLAFVIIIDAYLRYQPQTNSSLRRYVYFVLNRRLRNAFVKSRSFFSLDLNSIQSLSIANEDSVSPQWKAQRLLDWEVNMRDFLRFKVAEIDARFTEGNDDTKMRVVAIKLRLMGFGYKAISEAFSRSIGWAHKVIKNENFDEQEEGDFKRWNSRAREHWLKDFNQIDEAFTSDFSLGSSGPYETVNLSLTTEQKNYLLKISK